MPDSTQNKRKRARMACEPCRQRKRKCDGESEPCTTCTAWGYKCYYAPARGSKYKFQTLMNTAAPAITTAEPSSVTGSSGGDGAATITAGHGRSESSGIAAPAITTTAEPSTAGDSGDGSCAIGVVGHGHSNNSYIARSLSANSGAAFVRKMGLKVDPMNAPRLNLFGWNLGARHLPSGLSTAAGGMPIVNIISREEMRQLADVYFEKVDTCYGFIHRQKFFERLNLRWLTDSVGGIYDSVLAGVGALGLLFSERTPKVTELLLQECAKSMLDTYDAFTAPSLDLVTGWMLRVVYMRMTAPPYSAWLASSTLMHLIEAAGLHHESSDNITAALDAQYDTDIRRRLVGMAVHQNMWSSYDLGLSRVPLKANLSLPVLPRPGDFTAELLELLPISASLDPEETHDDCDLQRSLVQVLDRVHTQPPSVMAQTNVVLCILRRLQLLNMNTSPAIADRVLELFKKALRSAHFMIENCSPWHHAANIPFHTITILLEMDTLASLTVLPEAMNTVKLAATTYNTATMREAYATARLLVFLYQQRRSHDARLLGNVLDGDRPQGSEPDGTISVPEAPIPSNSTYLEEMPLLGELVADMPSLQGLDFEQFLNMDLLRPV